MQFHKNFSQLSHNSEKGGTNGSGAKRLDFRYILKVESIDCANKYDWSVRER